MPLTAVSVVIPAHDQVGRLRLVLCGLAHQTMASDDFEVIVVDDGSVDGTAARLAAEGPANLRVIRQWPRAGRNRARNRGLAAATGELIVFLDGDALPGPELVDAYWQAYREWPEPAVFCGFQRSLACVEYLRDPATGSLPEEGLPSVVRDFLTARAAELLVTPTMVAEDFTAVRARAQDGGYPFPESAERQRQSLDLLRTRPESSVAWVAFIPHNGAVPRELMVAGGGFDEGMTFSEGWELAYRLQRRRGVQVRAVGAESYHLYHRHAFTQDPLGETRVRFQAVEHLAAKHLDPRVRLLYFWYASLWPDPFIPREAVVRDLVDLDNRYRELSAAGWRDCELVLRQHPTLTAFVEPEVTHEHTA